ncbi:MAG: family transcriptional regulator, regulator of embCAB operon [Actinomycetota bacterium]|nr:family transcriptional regulator, regulator of embCAB operon [Actinomycetota bacterium]
MPLRIYLTGRIALESDSGITDETAFPGRQGRRAFVFLALSAQRPVARDALADALWTGTPPASWETAIKSLMSKLRATLIAAGVSGDPITTVSGCYQLRLPLDTWIDLETCMRSVDVSEAEIRRGEIDRAWSEATVATAIARRPFLPGEDAPWIDEVRNRLRDAHVRALDVLAEVWLVRGNPKLSVASSEQALSLEPFRETGYRLLMRAHAQAGNRAEALRAYDRCARTLLGELGVRPDPETTALRDAFREGSPRAPTRAQTMTIAVTDIVNSTATAARLGDARWSEILAEHDAAVLGCVQAVDGEVVKHLGDGFLLKFSSTGAALEALEALRALIEAIRTDQGVLAVRIGVHAGEPVEQDDDLFGLQINIAARVNALAGAGEILVSSVIRDLAPPGRFDFEDRRDVTLKGVPGDFSVYRLGRAPA